MDLLKKSFLYAVGFVAVAGEEAQKLIKEQRKRIEKMVKRVEKPAPVKA